MTVWKLRFVLVLLLFVCYQSIAQTEYCVPTKVWIYGSTDAPSFDEVKLTIQNLNKLNSENNTKIQYYLIETQVVNKDKFNKMRFYSQMPWQSIIRHDNNILNISISGGISKPGSENKDKNYSGVCFGLTGGVLISKGEDMSVITHEVGHFLGLKHQLDLQDNIMSYNPEKSKRRVFTDSQKNLMLKNLLKMKYSKLWKLTENEKSADIYEPDNTLDFATVLKINTQQVHTFHRTVDGKGNQSFEDEDWLKFSFTKKNKPINPILKIATEDQNLSLKITVLDNSQKILIEKTFEQLQSAEIPFDDLSYGNYYLRLSSSINKTISYTIEISGDENVLQD